MANIKEMIFFMQNILILFPKVKIYENFHLKQL